MDFIFQDSININEMRPEQNVIVRETNNVNNELNNAVSYYQKKKKK